MGLLEEALSRDPNFALAHALASRFHGELYWFGYDRTSARLALARAEAETALKLRPELGDARLALAYYYYYGGRYYDLALTELEFARQATPNDAEIWDVTGAIERRRGRWEEAVANFERALQLDPRNPSVIWNLARVVRLLAALGQSEAIPTDFRFIPMRIYSRWPLPRSIGAGTATFVPPLEVALRQNPIRFQPWRRGYNRCGSSRR